MHLSASGLHGTLPDNFGLIFPALLECLLFGNFLHGRIPSTFHKMTALLHLNLAKNNFGGKIPSSIGRIRNLEVLDLSFNCLTGLEESFIFNSSKLSLLNVANNSGLKILLPHFFKKLQPAINSLRSFNASSCDLTGNIPNVMWSFANLILVDVSSNSLTGRLPSPGDNMLFLLILDFSANNLTGDIPESYAKLLGLQTFDVSCNSGMRHGKGISGNIPRFARPDTTSFVRENENDHFTCPIIRFKYNNGIIKIDSSYYDRVYCVCDNGFYGYNGHCLSCMAGGLCSETRSKFSSFMQIAKGYWPSPVANNVTHLVSCQETRRTNYVCNPTGQCKCQVNTTDERGYFTTCNSGCICKEGSSGRLCSKCEKNFYSHGRVCLKCPSRKSDKVEVLLPVVLVGILAIVFVVWLAFFKRYRKRSFVVVLLEILVVTVLHVFNFLPAWLFEINIIVWILGVAGHGRKSRGVLKICIFYFQILDAMISNFNLWPPTVIKIQRYFSNVFNFQFEGLECYFPKLLTPVGKFSSLLIFPLCITAATGIVFIVYRLLCWMVNARPEKTIAAKYLALNMVIVFLNLIYFPIVKGSFSALTPCLYDQGFLYIPQNPWIDCPSAEYRIIRILGYCALVIYVIGVPFGVYLPLLLRFLIYRNGTVGEANVADTWLGSLYLPYHAEYRKFIEVFYLFRRALFASILAFVSSRSVLQTPLLSLAVLISLLLHMVHKPYICSRKFHGVDVENTLESFNLCVLMLSFVALGNEAQRSDSEMTLIWLVLGLNCFTTVLCIVIVLIRLVAKAEYEMLSNQ